MADGEKEDPYWDDDTSIVQLMRKREEVRDKLREERRQAMIESQKKVNAPRVRREGGGSSSAPRKKYEEFYEDTQKGLIVQNLLIRWWYAFDWPDPTKYIGEAPQGYEELDGMKGVFVSMNLEDLGKILDLRNKDMCPSLQNMSSKSAAELQALCLKAYDGQISQLAEAEGGGENVDTPEIIRLKKEKRHIAKINPDEAEAEAKKFAEAF
jgi:hypothetical protein